MINPVSVASMKLSALSLALALSGSALANDPQEFSVGYQFATDGERYTLKITPVMPEFRGVKSLDGVLAAGLNSRNVPVGGFGLAYTFDLELDPRLVLVVKPVMTLLFEQGEKIGEARLRFGLTVGVKF